MTEQEVSDATLGPPEEGQLVSVRERRFVVADVMSDALADGADRIGQHLVTLNSVEDDGLGEELQVVWELEPGARVLERSTLPAPTGLDEPEALDALLDAVRWAAVSTADHRNVQSPFRSGIEIDDYQLDPVVRSIDMPRANLLIADDVGLGKTIEAGLIILELMLRHRANRVLIVCPAGLQLKWQDEMHEKFGLDFRIVDSELMRQLRRTRGIHANPWTHFPRLRELLLEASRGVRAAGTTVHRYLCARTQPQGLLDPHVRCLPLGWCSPLREVRHGCRCMAYGRTVIEGRHTNPMR